ncbi:MAG TPA: hypothetical protein VHW05_00570 [Phenylobacterium sp.]|jgi:hypothetical protein|nr:hypothetical protein [Phenylobacterium sp.]
MTMHVLISIAVAVLLQVPGVNLGGVDAATLLQKTAPHAADARAHVCPCQAHRHAG